MFSNQRILITGANSGIGLSICELFLKNNANLVLFYNENRDGIDKLLENAPSNLSVEVYKVDLFNEKKIKESIESSLKTGTISAFIHSVTLSMENKLIIEKNWAEYKKHIELQTKSFFQIIKLLIPIMKTKKHGKIAGIHTGSTKYAKEMIDLGYQFITIASDFRALTTYAQNVVDEMKNTKKQNKTTTY